MVHSSLASSARHRARPSLGLAALVVIAGLCGVAPAVAQPNAPGLQEAPGTPASAVPPALSEVSFEQRLDAQLPLDLTFRDEDGQTVPLRKYFGQRPVVLTFVYYECPMLCTQVLNGLTSAMSVLTETVGKDFDVVTVSFDPRETPSLASGKKKAYLDRYQREGAANGWHFLTGDEASIAALTDAAGFHYAWDPQSSQFAHASGIVVVTPAGKVARYFFGIDYGPRDLKLALVESSAGRIGTLADKVLLYCYHYDPKKGTYSFVAMSAVRVGGAVTLVALLGFVVGAIRREERVGH